MKTCLVSLDLHHPLHTYSALYDRLRRLDFEPLQRQLWAASVDLRSDRIEAAVLPCLRPDDGVFVFSNESDDDYRATTRFAERRSTAVSIVSGS